MALDLSFDLDTVTLNLTKAIEAKKVDTTDLTAQFEHVAGQNLDVMKTSDLTTAEKKAQGNKDMQAALSARKNPGSIGMSFAGPDATGVNQLQNLIPSRISSRGKGRSL